MKLNEDNNDNLERDDQFDRNDGDQGHSVLHVSGMYQNWFLDYASYVILERAVPAIDDGLKPVQRRILHSMNELEDGRYNKVANIIGHAMKYHPHGDASIGDALVQMGQKDLMIDMQGNWGNILTGDSAAAARYIEARLSKFAQEVAFNPKTTRWQASYDGRNKEPIALPMKFPLLLAQGVEGIAVGLACKILPHNFIELIDGSIAVLRGKRTDIVPDFPTGGMADFSNYNDGLRGGKIRVRARISMLDKKTLIITEIPFGTNTTSLIDSILSANEKGKIKIRKVEDNTAEQVEILVHLAPGISPDKTIDALYAFTDCEISISPNAGVIENDKPRFVGVNEMLKISTNQTLGLLKMELEIEQHELQEQWHFASLEKLFIEKRIYRKIEEAETWEEVLSNIDKGLKPYKSMFHRDITQDDIVRLTEIRIKRISKYDSFKADEHIKNIEEKLKTVRHHLKNLVDYAVEYFRNLKKKYGAGRERKTEIRNFESIVATQVVIANQKLYVNREEGFAGYGLKKDEYIADCSDIDDIIIFRKDGTMKVTKIAEKAFVGKDLLHIAVFRKNDERTIYHMIYRDGPKGAAMIKRFAVTGITRDKDYDLTKGTKGSEVLYFTANPNGENEVVIVHLKPLPNVRKLQFDFDFSTLAIKGRTSMGNILSKYPVRKIVLKEKGGSTLSARKIWFDEITQRLSDDGRGRYLGEFGADDKILTVLPSGNYRLTGFDLSTHFDEPPLVIEKYHPDTIISAVYFDGESKMHFVKRFKVEPRMDKTLFISESEGSKLAIATTLIRPLVDVKFIKEKGKDVPPLTLNLAEFIDVKGLKAKGNKVSDKKVKDVSLIAPEEVPVEEEAHEEIEETTDEGLSPVQALLKAKGIKTGGKDGDPGEQGELELE